MSMGYDPTISIFAGVDPVLLRSNLATAQAAYAALSTGRQVVVASYAQGDGGAKSVTYSRTDGAQLVAYIKGLQAQLGLIPNPRRPTRFAF